MLEETAVYAVYHEILNFLYRKLLVLQRVVAPVGDELTDT